jgi:tripartite-type tricarboxylate transporter receptor subunit TctC
LPIIIDGDLIGALAARGRRKRRVGRTDMRAPVKAAAIAVAGMLATSSAGWAQSSFPNRPITFVVGFAAGGPSDIISRVIGAKLGEYLGQQVVIENKTGAGGTIATDHVARSEPDGYTLLNTTTANASNETLSKTLQARWGKDLVGVAALADTANVLVVHPSLGVKTMAEFVALAKQKPGELFYATAGVGSATHLTSELFNLQAGTKIMPVHYRGGSAAAKDLLSGQVKIMFSSIAPVIQLIKDGKLIGLSTTGLKRDPALPDLPTVAESLPGFETRLWIGMSVRAGTPQPIIDKLAAAAAKAVRDPGVKETLAKQGFEPLVMTPAEFDAFYRADRDKWAKVIKETGMDKQ